MRSVLRLGVTAVLSVQAQACQSYADGVKEVFSREFSCPSASIETRPRPDLNAAQVSGRTPPQPPPEVKADPARLAVWQANEDKAAAAANSGEDVYEARGCGHSEIYTCHRPQHHANQVSCWERHYPAGVARW